MENKPIINFDDAKKLFENGKAPENLSESKHIPESHPATYPQATPMDHAAGTEKQKLDWKGILFWIGVVVLAFVVGYSIVNGPALAQKIGYWFASIRGKTPSQEEILKPEVTVNESIQKSSNIEMPDNHIIIPKISVDAPIIWNVTEADVQSKLEEGVVHYKNTATPDQDGGNVFLTGHSSNFWWSKGKYNQVFALLSELENGDKIAITYKKVKYIYRVYDKFVVKPSQVDVMDPIEGKSTLTLMSCVPLGTNLNRLIVRSELLYKDEGKGIIESVNSTPSQTENQTPASGGTQSPTEVNTPGATSAPKTNTDLTLPST